MQFHGNAHIARNFQLAHHEGRRRVKLTSRQRLKILLRDRDRAVGILILVRDNIGNGRCINKHHAVVLEIEFQCRVKATILANTGAQAVGYFLQGRHLFSFQLCTENVYKRGGQNEPQSSIDVNVNVK